MFIGNRRWFLLTLDSKPGFSLVGSNVTTYSRSKEVRMNIYVGNIARNATEDELRQAFEAFGQVAKVSIIKDKFTGDSRGFGFVEMPVAEEAQKALAGLNGKDLNGQTLVVNEARPRAEGGRGGDRFGGRSGGRFGGPRRGGRF